jgi:hypothetical protein
MSRAIFSRKRDPISARQKELNSRIASLENEIKKLAQRTEGRPAVTVSRGVSRPVETPVRPAATLALAEPVFETVDQARVTAPEPPPAPRYNEHGVRKFDLPGAIRRMTSVVRGPDAANPQLVNYLAAGSIQGLRPLRYEKRIARNRFIFWAAALFLLLYGLAAVILRGN